MCLSHFSVGLQRTSAEKKILQPLVIQLKEKSSSIDNEVSLKDQNDLLI